jgi:hypothetical protein
LRDLSENCSEITFQDRQPDEAEFEDSGGIQGYISRAKNLIDKRKLYAEGIQ